MISAENWLKEHQLYERNTDTDWYTYMERFANHRTMELQAQILDFRTKFKRCMEEHINDQNLRTNIYTEALGWMEAYDKYFGITVLREGKLNKD